MNTEEFAEKIKEVTPEFSSSDVILLTGAGFTKNFGGFLATEMHSALFNNPIIQKSSVLKKLLLEDYDFESFYTEVVGHPSRYSSEDQATMRTAIEGAYESLDAATRGWAFRTGGPNAVNPYGLSELFVRALVSQPERKGLFFTLNQDLFMERRWGYRWPGIPSFRQDFYTIDGGQQIPGFVTVPNDKEVMKKAKADFQSTAGIVYLKLHGSYGWRSSDGFSNMVIGKDKVGLIAGSAILFWYLEIFARAILQGKKILIMGYGFNDAHINDLLAKAVQGAGLKIYVISTKPMERFVTDLKNDHPSATPLLDGVSGYFQYRLIDIFPTDQSETEYLRNINKALFT